MTTTQTPISPATFAALERQLSSDLNAVASPVPSERHPVAQMDEADYDKVGLSVAQIMKTCAAYLADAGFDADAAFEFAERAEAEYTRLANLRAPKETTT